MSGSAAAAMTRDLSASRLNDFLGCRHKAALWLDRVEAPTEPVDETVALIRAKGFEHEAAVLTRLEGRHGPATRIPNWLPMADRLRLTAEAIAAGSPLIYQATLQHDGWIGFPDFIVRTPGTSAPGIAYEPHDAKLSRHAKAEHLIQLSLYAALLEATFAIPVGEGFLHLGDGTLERFDLRQTRHITAHLKARFGAFASLDDRGTHPVRTAACSLCDYAARCESQWRAADSPVFIAGSSGAQIVRYAEAGAATLTQIAALDPARPAPRIGAQTHARIVAQARLQRQAAVDGAHAVELLPPEPLRGFALLPGPAPGDLFFDIEGDPLIPEGLEYLFGLYGPLGSSGEDIFLPIWAHDRAAEKAAFEQLIDFFDAHLRRFPQARIYHYAPYEPSALRRLMQTHATREAAVDRLLREHRFVDLYRVVRQGLRASTEGYSLKDLETIYWGGRGGEVTNAGDSIVQYERWRETGDPKILDDIARYNQDDVVSTARLRQWLETLRPAGVAYGVQPSADENDDRSQARAEFEAGREALAAAIRASAIADEAARELMAQLLWFHQRIQKPVWWAIFDRQTWTDEELIEDVESLGHLTLVSQAVDKRSFVATYAFPLQDTRLKPGARPKIAATLEPAGAIVDLSPEAGRVTLRRGTAAGDFPETCSLTPGDPISQKVLVEGLMGFFAALLTEPAAGRAWLDFLARRSPRLRGRAFGQAVVPTGATDLVAEVVRAARDLDHSCLIVQGPPGTGKTYTIARAIVALLRKGKRVGVTSNSHKAIYNVLTAVEAHAREIGFVFVGVKKATAGDAESSFEGDCIATVASSKDVSAAHRLVGGTAFHFAGEAALAYDHLFVDEAGQVALGNLAAMAGCARNLVLVGDQMQLPQPVQGVHPGESGLSCLDYAMQGHATVPPDRGVLLNVTRRMHPDICRFVSDAMYEGRLTEHPCTRGRRLVLRPDAHPALAPTGLKLIELDHEGCTQRSEVEADAVRDLMASLLRQSFQDGETVRRLTADDILVVSPFNMQVDLLKRRLGETARVGTVDKFQGQEAPVVIVSMATSFGGDAPRGTAFLFDRNRLNVAVSRAQCLALIVRGRHLLEAPTPNCEDLVRLDMHVAVGWRNEHLS
jgi:uncharacterized protein